MRLSTTTRTRLIAAASTAALASGALAAGEQAVVFQHLGQRENYNLWLLENSGTTMAWAFDVTGSQAQVREYDMTVAIRNDTGTVLGRGQYLPGHRGSGSSTAPSIRPTETSGVDPSTHVNTESANSRKSGPMGAMFHEIPGNEPMGPEVDLIARQSPGSGTPTVEEDVEPLSIERNSNQTYTLLVPDASKLINSQLLHVEVRFEGPTGAVIGTSPRFAVAMNMADANAKGLPASLERNQGAFPTNSLTPVPGSTGTNIPSDGMPLSAAPTATASPGAEPSRGGAVPSTDASGTSGASPNGGLSTGAIAGIAVACGVVGLGLIAGLVFWLVRRRGRGALRSKDARPYGGRGGPGSRTRELVAEKEAQSGVRESSPHSPHSDVALAGPTAALTAANLQQQQQQQERSYSPYSDHPVAPGAGEEVAPTPAAAERHHQQHSRDLDSASSPHSPALRPVSGADGTAGQARYAHLIEEGMTPQEIARIEEEERQLDAAIEQAARR